MKALSKYWFSAVAAALCLLLAPAAARAQSTKPVAIFSVASINENLADLNYLARISGMEDSGTSAGFFVRALTAGIDKERPIGMYVVPQGNDFHAVAFIPVSDLKVLLEVQKEYLGTPEDVGDGIKKIGTDRKAFLKEQAGWAFVAENKDILKDAPPDPLALLGELPKSYNVAVKLMVQNVPEQMRRHGLDQIKFGMEKGFSVPGTRGRLDKQGGEQLAKMWLGNVEKLMTELDELTFGLGIDAEKKHVVVDVRVAAKEGTERARHLATQTVAKSKFAGFLLPEASVTFGFVNQASADDLQQVGPAMKASREMWSKQIDDSPDIAADKREAYKRVLNQLFDVIEKTAMSGKTDFGGALLLLPKSVSFVAGAYVADGPAIEKSLKEGLDLMKGKPNMPQVEFNSGTIGEVKLHRITTPVPQNEREARQLLGDKLEILVGIGPQSVLVSGGKDAEGLLKKVLERSVAEADRAVPPLQLNVSLLSILKFYQSLDQNPKVGELLTKLEQAGNDRITVVNTAGPRESTTRIEIQEGLFQTAGGVVKALGAGMQPPGR